MYRRREISSIEDTPLSMVCADKVKPAEGYRGFHAGRLPSMAH